MVRIIAFLSYLTAVSSVSAFGQDPGFISRPIEARACPASDSLIGTAGGRVKGDISGSYRTDLRLTSAYSHSKPRGQHHSPVHELSVTMQFRGPPPTPAPPLILQVNVKERQVRPPDSLLVTLRLDDSIETVLGTATSSQYRDFMPADIQTYLVTMNVDAFAALARARKAGGTIGMSPFDFAGDDLKSIRALFVAGICGWTVNH
jgi:hypothetical protein